MVKHHQFAGSRALEHFFLDFRFRRKQEKMDTNEPNDTLDARNLHLPTLTIASVILFCVWITFVAMTEKSKFEARITHIENVLLRDLFTETDHRLWCLKTQIVNQGWVCSDVTLPEKNR